MQKAMSERLWVAGTSPNFLYWDLACENKWTQSDLKLCKNDGSIRSKTNEKEGQLDQTLRRKFIQNGTNWAKSLKL